MSLFNIYPQSPLSNPSFHLTDRSSDNRFRVLDSSLKHRLWLYMMPTDLRRPGLSPSSPISLLICAGPEKSLPLLTNKACKSVKEIDGAAWRMSAPRSLGDGDTLLFLSGHHSAFCNVHHLSYPIAQNKSVIGLKVSQKNRLSSICTR